MNALIETDIDAIAENTRRMREIAGVDVIGVAKANGYGHGALFAAQGIQRGGAVAVGVADIAEALALRGAGLQGPLIAWLHGADPDFAAARGADIEVGISGLRQLEQAGVCGGLRIHLKLDTGLGRNGAPEAEWDALFTRAHQLQSTGRLRVAGVMSHLAGAGEVADARQHELFRQAVAAASPMDPESSHLCASAGTLAGVTGTIARVGVACYGLDPDGHDADGSVALGLGLRPALRLTAPVEGGRLAFGYRHGLLAAGQSVLVGERRIPIVEAGAHSAHLAAPVTGTAVILGSAEHGEPTAGEWARSAGTINYEIVTRLAPTIARRAV